MRTLRFSAFFVFAIVQCLSAQNTQNSSSQQPAAAQAQEKNPAPPQPSTSLNQIPPNNKNQQPATQPPKGFKFKLLPSKPAPEKKVPTGFLDRGFRASMERGTPRTMTMTNVHDADQAGDTAIDASPDTRNPGFDSGIYAIGGGSGQFCGSILSYNFSPGAPGEMPRLESITTCTPSNKVVPRRARDRGKRAHPALLLQTVF